ncbi:MAG: hypothetical protein ACTSQY_04865 [Candidatus Odinarchaeia archaeon]
MELEKVKAALMDARPSIEKYYQLEETILRLANENKVESEFLGRLSRLIEDTDDIIFKTDLKIFKNVFEKIS